MKKRVVSLSKLYKKEMSNIKAGGAYVWEWPPMSPDLDCGCNCLYADTGGSAIEVNGMANMESYLFSPQQ